MGCGSSSSSRVHYLKKTTSAASTNTYYLGNRNTPETTSTDMDGTQNSIGEWSYSGDVEDSASSRNGSSLFSKSLRSDGRPEIDHPNHMPGALLKDQSPDLSESGHSGSSQGEHSLQSLPKVIARRSSRRVCPSPTAQVSKPHDGSQSEGHNAELQRRTSSSSLGNDIINRSSRRVPGKLMKRMSSANMMATLEFHNNLNVVRNFGLPSAMTAWEGGPVNNISEVEDDDDNIELDGDYGDDETIDEKPIGLQCVRPPDKDGNSLTYKPEGKGHVTNQEIRESREGTCVPHKGCVTKNADGAIHIDFPSRESPRLGSTLDKPPLQLSHLEAFERTIYPRDFFWWKFKKDLIGNYQRMCEIDERVLMIKADHYRHLDDFLADIHQGTRSEAEKFRAVFRWMAANIAFKVDDNQSNNQAPKPESQIAARILDSECGDCKGFTILLKYLLNESGIDCDIIEGIARGASYLPGCSIRELVALESPARHCWNRVKLNGCWFLCDPTWATELEVREDNVVRKASGFREVWFLSDPEVFISTHMPLKFVANTGEVLADVDEQVLYNAVDDLDEWNRSVWTSSSAKEWGMNWVSHPRAVLHPDVNFVRISVSCAYVMRYSSTLTETATHEQLSGYTMVYTDGNDSAGNVNIDVRLPGPGTYLLCVQAKPPFELDSCNPGMDDTDVVFTYLIVSNLVEPQLPFAAEGGAYSWGLTPDFINSGCGVANYAGAVLTASAKGSGSVSILLPTHDLFPHKIQLSPANQPDVNLEECFYTERTGRAANVHFNLMYKGDFILTFWIRTSNAEDYFDTSVSFLIQVREDVGFQNVYPPFPQMWGLQAPAVSLGICLPFLKSSTVRAEDGMCSISMELTRAINVSHRLHTKGRNDWRRFIYAERDRNFIHYHMRIPIAGRFKFTIAGADDDASQHQIAAVLLVENLDCFTGPLYPDHENCPWGVRPSMNELGLKSSVDKTSTMKAGNREAIIDISLPNMSFPLRAVLTQADEPDVELQKSVVTVRTKDPKKVSVWVRLGPKRLHSLRLYEGETKTLLASYLIISEASCKDFDYFFENYQGIYGPTLTFYQQGMVAASPTTSYIRTNDNSSCDIILRVPLSNELRLITNKDGEEVKGHILAERQDKWVIIHFQGKQKGFYQLRGFAKINDNRHDLAFVYLIENVAGCRDWRAYPYSHGVWGLNSEAYNLNIKIAPNQTSNAVIQNWDGIAYMKIIHSGTIRIKAWLKPSELIPAQNGKDYVLVEKHKDGSLLKVTTPRKGYFQLDVAAKDESEREQHTEEKQTPDQLSHGQIFASLLVDSRTDAGEQYAFPTFCNFTVGCQLFEPTMNPLHTDTVYFFKVKAPGALKMRLWDNTSDWREDLEAIEDDTFVGYCDVKGQKELWVTAKFPRGEAGCYRNLLMYHVR